MPTKKDKPHYQVVYERLSYNVGNKICQQIKNLACYLIDLSLPSVHVVPVAPSLLAASAPDDQIFDWTCAPMDFTSVLNIQTFMVMSWSHTVHTITSSGHPRSEITWCWTDGHIMH